MKSEKTDSNATRGIGGGRPPATNRGRLNLAFLVLLLVLTAAAFFYIVRMFFVPVLLALALASLLHPVHAWLERLFAEERT